MNNSGTGLGLSICKNIVEQIGGNVNVESELGKGSKFSIVLNLQASDEIVNFPQSSSVNEKIAKLEEMNAFGFTPSFTSNFHANEELDLPFREYLFDLLTNSNRKGNTVDDKIL
jgi:hypothetical protein